MKFDGLVIELDACFFIAAPTSWRKIQLCDGGLNVYKTFSILNNTFRDLRRLNIPTAKCNAVDTALSNMLHAQRSDV